MDDNYDKNVFVNCPFDDEYRSLLQPILFTIIYLGYEVKIALERLDSGETRYSKICELIKNSKYGIHDLSRIEAKKKGDYFRLNMPFELGLDIGCKEFNKNKYSDKKHLILAGDPHKHKAAISDLSNSDVEVHENEPAKVVRNIRNWFYDAGLRNIPTGTQIWYKFSSFISDFHVRRKKEGYSEDDIYEMPVCEYIEFVKLWLK